MKLLDKYILLVVLSFFCINVACMDIKPRALPNIIPLVFNLDHGNHRVGRSYINQNDVYTAYNVEEHFSDNDLLSDEITLCDLQDFLERLTYRDEQSTSEEDIVKYFGIDGLSRSRFNRYKSTTKIWTHSLYNTRDFAVEEKWVSGNDSQFGVYRELRELARIHNLNFSNIDADTSSVDQKQEITINISQTNAPLLFSIIENLNKLSNKALNNVSLGNLGSISFLKDGGLHININQVKHMTNAEIECIIAHEFRHFQANHLAQLNGLQRSLYDFSDMSSKDRKMLESFSRAIERDADTFSLEKTNNPKAMISALLKTAFLKRKEPKNPHPTIHERISYALTQLTN